MRLPPLVKPARCFASPPPPPQRARIQIWLYEQAFVRIEGRIIVRLGRTSRGVPNLRSCSLEGSLPSVPFLPLPPQGFDEFMNVVLDDAEELNTKLKSRKPLGRILLKGDNIALIQTAAGGAAAAASSGAGAASAAAAMSEAP